MCIQSMPLEKKTFHGGSASLVLERAQPVPLQHQGLMAQQTNSSDAL